MGFNSKFLGSYAGPGSVCGFFQEQSSHCTKKTKSSKNFVKNATGQDSRCDSESVRSVLQSSELFLW